MAGKKKDDKVVVAATSVIDPFEAVDQPAITTSPDQLEPMTSEDVMSVRSDDPALTPATITLTISDPVALASDDGATTTSDVETATQPTTQDQLDDALKMNKVLKAQIELFEDVLNLIIDELAISESHMSLSRTKAAINLAKAALGLQ